MYIKLSARYRLNIYKTILAAEMIAAAGMLARVAFWLCRLRAVYGVSLADIVGIK